MVGAEANGLVLIVAEIRHGRRQYVLRLLIGIAREVMSLALEPGEIERLRRTVRGDRGARGGDDSRGRQVRTGHLTRGQGKSSFQKSSV